MGLALVRVPLSDFQSINHHVRTHAPTYQNMHLRQARYQNNQRVLRYLHAMHAPNAQQVDGMISGPGVFWSYQLLSSSGQTRIRVLAHQASQAEERRIEQRFLHEVLSRVQEERRFAQAQRTFGPRRIPGQFYLRRSNPGMLAAHPHAVVATSSRALDARFVGQLHAWNLMLLCP